VQNISDRAPKLVSLVLGIVTLAAVLLLFVEDAIPRLLPAHSHDVLAAFSLAMIACAYLVFKLAHPRGSRSRSSGPRSSGPRGLGPRCLGPLAELLKTILLAAAFLFWAANQLWSTLPQASLFNDIAIGLFVLDVFFVIAGWPAGPDGGVLDDSVLDDGRRRSRCSCGCACCDGSSAP
jgi:hypothetical protein